MKKGTQVKHGKGKAKCIGRGWEKRSYEGFWKDDELHGQVKLTLAGGESYWKGEFKEGKRHGVFEYWEAKSRIL